jgi:hypothetical protein
MGVWTEGLKKAETKYCDDVPPGKVGTSIGGKKVSSSEGCSDLETQIYGVFEDIRINEVCCVPK